MQQKFKESCCDRKAIDMKWILPGYPRQWSRGH